MGVHHGLASISGGGDDDDEEGEGDSSLYIHRNFGKRNIQVLIEKNNQLDFFCHLSGQLRGVIYKFQN